MASVPNGIETLLKISIARVGRTNVTDRRQTTDGRTTTYSERELTFTFAKNDDNDDDNGDSSSSNSKPVRESSLYVY